MKITLYQYATIWLNPERNLDLVEAVCQKIEGQTELLILPEMFATGYVMDTGLLNQDWEQYTTNRLLTMAQKYKLQIGGSIPTFKSNCHYNTFILVSPNGYKYIYNKTHLFTLAGEKIAYTEGETISSCCISSWKVQTLICYDLRFAYLSFGTEKADIILYSANWPVARISHWLALLKARAIENQCYVVGVNRTGKDNNGYDYNGCSAVYDFNGDQVILLDNSEMFSTVTLNKDSLLAYRKKLPFLNDIRTDLI